MAMVYGSGCGRVYYVFVFYVGRVMVVVDGRGGGYGGSAC